MLELHILRSKDVWVFMQKLLIKLSCGGPLRTLFFDEYGIIIHHVHVREIKILLFLTIEEMN